MQDTIKETSVIDIEVAEVEVPTVKAVDIPGLVNALKQYADAAKAVTEFEAIKRKTRKLIEAHIPDGGAIVFDGREVAYFKALEGTRVSNDLLLELYPKIHEAVQVPNSPRFTVDL